MLCWCWDRQKCRSPGRGRDGVGTDDFSPTLRQLAGEIELMDEMYGEFHKRFVEVIEGRQGLDDMYQAFLAILPPKSKKIRRQTRKPTAVQETSGEDSREEASRPTRVKIGRRRTGKSDDKSRRTNKITAKP